MNRKPPRFLRLHSILASKLGRLRAVTPCQFGTSGRSYRVETDDSQFFVKLFSADSDVLLGPRAQFELLEKLAGSAIAPLPIAFDESAGLLVTEYVDDAMLVDLDELHRPKRLQEIAGLLNVLHRTQADIPRFAPQIYAAQYIDRIGGRASLSVHDQKRADELLDLAAGLDFQSACLCHNDLIAENLLFGLSSKLIDFDYAVIAPPILDLASVVVMNSLSPAAETELLNAYFENSDFPFSAPEFVKVQRLVRLLAHFWSLASRDAEAAIVVRYRIQDV